jgi:hypothetical protein
MNELKKKPGVLFWATVVVVGLLVAYPLSIGPVMWLEIRGLIPDWISHGLAIAYLPLVRSAGLTDTTITAYEWYIQLWIGNGPPA